ncbi:L-lactate dehydrogenase [Pediococcus damnosus]|nr:L-lactate dehydrogenase [Pediococcus damnosus]
MRKFGIIGVGNVGRTVAYTLVTKGIADSLVLIDKDRKRARAEQVDLQDAQARLSTTTQVSIQDYEDLKDVEVLYISAGDVSISTNGGNRFDEFKLTSAVVKEIAPKIVASGFHGIIIDIMNPCDAVTSYLQKLTGFSKQRVFGTGTFLDTARMQRVVGEKLNINSRSVEGYVLGEHGNTQFVAWSSVRVQDKAIKELP